MSGEDAPVGQNLQILRQGKFAFILGHPEDFLDQEVLEVFRKAKWSGNVKFLMIDEAHCVVQWSTDFRPKFRDLGDLSSFFPNVKIIALTATATIKMQKEIARILNMKQPSVVTAQLDRPNIAIRVLARSPNTRGADHSVVNSYTQVFAPILDELKEKKSAFPKTIVYTALKWCGFGNELGVKVLTDGTVSSCGVAEIAQFHAPLPATVVYSKTCGERTPTMTGTFQCEDKTVHKNSIFISHHVSSRHSVNKLVLLRS